MILIFISNGGWCLAPPALSLDPLSRLHGERAATLRAWLEQHDAAGLWPLVEVALDDERLLLIVDGLDEWVSESAGRSAVIGLETFLGTPSPQATARTPTTCTARPSTRPRARPPGGLLERPGPGVARRA
jgi:hypothetical protein